MKKLFFALNSSSTTSLGAGDRLSKRSWAALGLWTLFLVLLLSSLSCASLVRRGRSGDDSQRRDGLIERGPFPWIGEEMHFVVKHSSLDAPLLEATIEVGEEGVAEDGTRYIPIHGVANSVALARIFARVDDSADTYVDPLTWAPIYAYKDLNENEKSRSYHVWYWPEQLYATVEKHIKGKVHKREVPLPADTLDALSWIYHMREVDLSEGSQGTWMIYDGWRLSRMVVVVQEREEVWTPLGIYDAYRVDLYREKLETHWPLGALSSVYVEPETSIIKEKTFVGNAWIADDPVRTPLRLVIETKLGDLDFLLQDYYAPTATKEDATEPPEDEAQE